MNKQELLDKAVHELRGVYANSIEGGNAVEHFLWHIGDGNYQRLNGESGFSGEFICTKDEFQQRARELGYINGYRWGVEYPTNGKKPDLAYDVEIDCYYDNEWNSAKVYHIDWTDCGFSSVVTKFKITDQRYKPVDTSYLDSVSEIPESKSNAENVSDWYDYEAQRAIALPPVGEKVEVFLHWSESWSGWVVIVGHDHDGVIWRNGSDNKSYIYSPRSEIRPLDYATRKAEAEKKRVVDAAYDEAIKAGCVDFGQWLSHLYDAGYLKLPAE